MTIQEAIDRTHKHGVEVKNQIVRLLRLEKALEALNRRRRQQLPKAQKFAMYDTITITAIPLNAVAVAGYVNGHWPTYPELVKKFPRAKHLSISVNSSGDADCLDVETGDASPEQAPAWCKRQKALGKHRPVLYANRSTMPQVLAAIGKAGVARSEVRLWVAEYTGEPHIPVGYDACQWTSKALGRNLDQSLCNGYFL